MNSARVSITITPRTPGHCPSTASTLSRCSWSSTTTTDEQAGNRGGAESLEVHRGAAILWGGAPATEGLARRRTHVRWQPALPHDLDVHRVDARLREQARAHVTRDPFEARARGGGRREL